MISLFLRNHKYRWCLLHTTFGGVGSGMFGMLMIWIIHAEYQNPFYTGLAGVMFAVTTIGSFLIGPFVDRRSKILLIRVCTFIELIILSLVLAASLTDMLGLWILLAAILINSTTNIFYGLAFSAYKPTIVASEDLLTSNSMSTIAGIVTGIAVGVILYVSLMHGADFVIMYIVMTAFLFISFVFSLFLRAGEPVQHEFEHGKSFKIYFAELKEGLRFMAKGAVFALLIVVLVQDLAASIAYVNIPMLVQVHTGYATAYIVLTAMAMLGGMLGAYGARILGPKLVVWKYIALCFILAGAARILFINVIADNFSHALYVHILYIGISSTAGMAIGTLMQKLPPKHMIARVSAAETSLTGITSVLGAFLGGILGTIAANVDIIFVIQGIIYLLIGLGVCLSKSLRRLPKVDDVTEEHALPL